MIRHAATGEPADRDPGTARRPKPSRVLLVVLLTVVVLTSLSPGQNSRKAQRLASFR